MIVKRISSVAFAIAFMAAIILFTGYGTKYISLTIAQNVFIGAGAIGILLNLVSFQQGKHAPMYSLLYWGSSIVLFIGLVFRIQHWPFSTYILIVGMVMLGSTFFIPSKRTETPEKDEELLDNFD